jgi:hypothetical protein
MRPNGKRIAGFALKSRLPSMYASSENVEAGGLMSYRADETDGYRRVVTYIDKILRGSKTCRSARRAAHEVRTGDQSQNCQTDWAGSTPGGTRAGDQVDQVDLSERGDF